jgi:hypothetical protein
MKYIWVSRADSANFSFEAYGATKEEASITFAAGLRRHADKTGADQAWVDALISETEPRRVALGVFYRDGSALR